jgi:hypothetical protein
MESRRPQPSSGVKTSKQASRKNIPGWENPDLRRRRLMEDRKEKSVFEKIMEAEKLKSTIQERQEVRNTALRPKMPKDQRDPPPSIDENVFLIPIDSEGPPAKLREDPPSAFSLDVLPSGNRAVSPIILYSSLRDPEDYSLDGSFGGSLSIIEPDGLSPGGARHGGTKHTDGDEEPVPIDLTAFQGHLSDCYDSTEERSYNETRSDGPESDGSQHYTHSFNIVSSDRVSGLGVITDEPPSSGQSSSKTPSAGKNESWRGGQGLDLIYQTQDASVQNVSIRTSHTVNGYSSNGYTSNGDTSIESSFASFNFSSGDSYVTKQNRPSDTSNAGANGGYSSTGESSSIENSLQSRQSPTFAAGEQNKKISHLSDRFSFPTKRSPVDSNHNNALISRLRPRFRPRPKHNSMESHAV